MKGLLSIGLLFVAVPKVSVGCFASSADLLPVVIQTATVSPAATSAVLGDDAGCIGSGSVHVGALSAVTTSAITERRCIGRLDSAGEAAILRHVVPTSYR